MRVSIVMPAHNEEKRIEKTLEDYASFFGKKYGKDFEILVVLNACKDDTIGVVKRAEKKHPQIKHLNFKQGGKGFALIEGFKASRGEIIGFTDADDATSAEQFYKLIKEIDSFDGAIASRYSKGSVIKPKQPFIRQIASRVFNFLVRVMFLPRFSDTQCGAKIFKKEAMKGVLPHLGITSWAFDVNLLYLLNKKGYKVKEVPIIWKDDKGSKLKVGKVSIEMFLAIVQLRLVNSPFRRLLRPFKPAVGALWRMLK